MHSPRALPIHLSRFSQPSSDTLEAAGHSNPLSHHYLARQALPLPSFLSSLSSGQTRQIFHLLRYRHDHDLLHPFFGAYVVLLRPKAGGRWQSARNMCFPGQCSHYSLLRLQHGVRCVSALNSNTNCVAPEHAPATQAWHRRRPTDRSPVRLSSLVRLSSSNKH